MRPGARKDLKIILNDSWGSERNQACNAGMLQNRNVSEPEGVTAFLI